MTRQILAVCQKLAVMLTQRQQQQQGILWNKRVVDERAFVPRKKRERTSREEARIQNLVFGSWASACLKDVLRQVGGLERWRRFYDHKKIVAVGYGRGYDSKWVMEAALAGLQTLWLDVSSIAQEWAWEDITRQMKEAQAFGVEVPLPNALTCEIHTTLMDPASMGLELDEVSVWYVCRVLGNLINRTVPTVLEVMGESLGEKRDPEKRNRVVIINAFREDNPTHQSYTSTLVYLGMVRWRLNKGAGRKVNISTIGTYQYFGQKYRAIVAQAD